MRPAVKRWNGHAIRWRSDKSIKKGKNEKITHTDTKTDKKTDKKRKKRVPWA